MSLLLFFHVYFLLLFSALNVGFDFCSFSSCPLFLVFLLPLLPGFRRSLCTCQRTKHCRGRAASAASRVPWLVGWVRKDRGGGEKNRLRGFKETGYPGYTFMLVKEHGWKMTLSMAVGNGSSKDILTGLHFCFAPPKKRWCKTSIFV